MKSRLPILLAVLYGTAMFAPNAKDIAALAPSVSDIMREELSENAPDVWKKTDGSTATIPLTDALYKFFGGSTTPPSHNTTPNAYHHLFDGMADIIFVTYPSEHEFAEAKEKGVEMEIVPLVKDALVFLVNIENPVDGVSLEQLRDIYAGGITGWGTLGGMDEDIVPYQRTPDSGSQTLLNKLLIKDGELIKPPVDWVLAQMDTLVEVVSGYDNARDALGYSVFYYVNNMYGNDRFKLLAVDSVKPSRETIARGEYPLEDYYYAVIRKDTPNGSPLRKLIKWLLTAEGQAVLAQAGYIPLAPPENIPQPSGEGAGEGIDPVYLGETDESAGTGGTEIKPVYSTYKDDGTRYALSDLFYDGFNYIRYINDEIIEWMDSPESTYLYSLQLNTAPVAENIMRPFTGIPVGYPHFAVVGINGRERYLQIQLPENNPFFNRRMTFDIRLTSDISPYGLSSGKFAVSYDNAGQIRPHADLFALEIQMPDAPEIAEKINRQLTAWADGFPQDKEKMELLDMFIENQKADYNEWNPSQSDEYVYRLQPFYGLWGDYLSVNYMLRMMGGPPAYEPMLFNICFDIRTGEPANLAEQLPENILHSDMTVFEPITQYAAGEYITPVYFEDYTPPENTAVTSAWMTQYDLNLLITEPDGRVLQVILHRWTEPAE